MNNEHKDFFLNEYRHLYYRYHLEYEKNWNSIRCKKYQAKLEELERIINVVFDGNLSNEIFEIAEAEDKKILEHLEKFR